VIGALGVTLCLALARPGARGDPPNIVLAIADDLDPEHPGFCGNPLARTPNLDGLAAAGVTFSVLYAQPVCRPALATLLTGRWPHQVGIVHNLAEAPLAPVRVLPELLRARGYATFCGGKFWEGDHHLYGFTDPETRDERFARDRDVGQDELFRFLERRAKEGPWFVWWAPNLPHVPHRPPVRFAQAFEAVEIPIPEGFRGPEAEYVEAERALLAMEAWMDAELGRFLRKLDELGEREDTVIVFLSDNGWSTAGHSKGTPFERGVRSPLVVSVPHGPGPRRVDALVDLVDVTATLLDYAGVPRPAEELGQSLRPWLEGGTGPSREHLFGAAYVRRGAGSPAELAYALYGRDARWKYVLYLRDPAGETLTPGGKFAPILRVQAGQQALYDLAADPEERVDLAQGPEQAERVKELRQRTLAWWRTSGGGELPQR
jgi:uncharacterized sulfatase